MSEIKGEILDGKIHRRIKPRCCADVDEAAMGNIRGSVEAQSSQPIVGERHLHYQSGHRGAVVGEYGIVIGEISDESE